MFPEINSMVDPQDLMKLNEALRKSSVGYQTPAVPSAGNPLSPLVPQSIEGMLSVATHTMDEITFWKNIPKVSVNNTLHEYVVVDEHGIDLDPFISEGGGGSDTFALGQSEYSRKSVKIKYMAERRQISDVASMVGLIGDNRTAMSEETERGTLSLMKKVETQLFHGDESLNPEGFDGILKQLRDAGSTKDLKGGVPTPLLLSEVLGEVYSAPNFGKPDCIYVEPRIHSELIRQSIESGRHDQFQITGGNGLTFGAYNLSISAPYGSVPVKVAPFLHTATKAPSAGKGTSPVTLSGANVSVTSPAVAGSTLNQTQNDINFVYKLIAVGKQGYSAPYQFSATIANGDATNIVVPSSVAQANVLYYRLYRSENNGTADTCRLVKQFTAKPANGTDQTIVFQDTGLSYNTSSIIFAQHTPDCMQFVRLLDFLRRPLASVSSVTPFLLMLFGSPVIKLPRKMFALDGCAFNDTSGITANYLSEKF